MIAHQFLTQRAWDLMSRNVVLLPKEMSLPGAAHLLAQASVSGAPVVNEQGRCIGVLSNTDFVHFTDKSKTRKQPCLDRVCDSWDSVSPDMPSGEQVADEQVANYMTKDPVTVLPHTTIRELARMMIDAHIHRVIVVDKEKRPIGIVSSTDILAAVAHADDDH
ncbi:MAG: CBS domain-containing protein [Gemmataceae bacterium]|nr:CBS domain-containing protein [Gemmataceae bacterium]